VTTIAYKDGIIAYDSRISAENIIQDDDYDKYINCNDVHLFMCGSTEDWMKFAELYCNNQDPERSLEASAIVFREGKLFKSGIEECNEGFRIWECPLRLENHASIGSGSHFALAFMDAGYSAYDAINATMKRDPCTGGKIRRKEICNLIKNN